MDLIYGLTEDYLAAIASYKLQQLLLGATCSDWGDEPIPREPTLVRKHTCTYYSMGKEHTHIRLLRMDRGPFFNLVRMLNNDESLRDTHHVSIEEQLAMLLDILEHNAKNKVVSLHFIFSRRPFLDTSMPFQV